MFDGVPADQLHQFIAASRTTSSSLPLPLPNIPLSSFPNLQPFDHRPHHYNIIHPHPHPHPPPPHDLVQLPQPAPPPPPPPHSQILHPSVVLHRRPNDQEKQDNSPTLVLPREIERERASSELGGDPWSNDELLALLRIRSTMENWFPEFTWEHVSRKLAEVGFKRSAEKCKEKFEEESRYFNNINFNKNFRFLTELEHLYQPPPPPPPPPHHNHPQPQEQEEEKSTQNVVVAEDPTNQEDQPALESPNDNQRVTEKEEEVVLRAKSDNKKRKRQRRFEMLKGFCEDIVNKLMAQQEEIHGKLLEDMVRRDEEKVAKEEEWKKQEMERMNKELETMAHEQAVAGDRQATIIHFLKKLTSSASTSSSTEPSNAPKEPIASSIMVPKSTTSTTTTTTTTTTTPRTPTSLTEAIAPQSPTSSTISTKLAVISSPADQPKTQSPTPERPKTQNPSSDEKAQDLGKRWPRDEVLALINLRCSLFTNVEQQDKENGKDGGTAVKAPLWERISQGMSELGYKRNAKRCKEKWENINKYFRKTKDVNKKRSVDSRTCPYFQQLSALYNQGVLLVPPSDHHHHHQQQAPPPLPPSTENNNQPADRDDEGENSKTNNNMVQQTAAFDFEF